MAMYRCKRCNYLYIDDQNDMPFDKVETEAYKCPRCKCSKKMFEKID
ncbi:MAG: rubredoxin [Promethearchaeota archaeon]